MNAPFHAREWRRLINRDDEAPLWCLHCSGSNARQWSGLQALLPRPLHTPDLLGYAPGQTWPLGASVSLDEEAQHLQALMGDSPEGVHLLGHSYGGAVALQLALRAPQRVRSLTLFEPVRFALLREDADQSAWHAITSVGREISALVLCGRPLAGGERFVDYWSGPQAWNALPAARRAAIAARMPRVSADFEALFSDRIGASDLAQVRVPVQLLVGTRSPWPARRVSQMLAEALPHATLHVLPGLGHMGPLEQPDRILPFLPDGWQPQSEASALAA